MKGTRAAAIVAISLVSFMIVLPALAVGIGVAPTRFELTDAFRGSTYFCSFLLLNPGDQEAEYVLSSEGEAGDWISFHAGRESAAAIDRVTVPAGSRTQIAVKFTVPENATDGVHKASIVVESVQQKGNGAGRSAQTSRGGASVVLRAHADVTIEVTGTRIVSGEVIDIAVEDMQAGHPITATIHFRNTGNVQVQPRISLHIFKHGELMKSFSWDQVTIAPDTAEVIQVEAETEGLEMGECSFRLTVSLDGMVVAAKEGPLPVIHTVTVQPGDTLSRIAAKYGVSLQALAKANDIADPDRIYVGQVLRIPSTTELAPTPEPTATSVTAETPPTKVVSSQATASPETHPINTPARGKAQPTVQITPVITAEEAQAAMIALAQAAGCTPQVAMIGAALCGLVVMRSRQKG